MPIMYSLDLFRKTIKCSTTWNLEIYNAVVISKLIYGLETLQHNCRTFNRVSTFHMRCIRNNLGIPLMFVDRIMTDEMGIAKCKEIISQWSRCEHHTKVVELSEIIRRRRLSLLGHILRRILMTLCNLSPV